MIQLDYSNFWTNSIDFFASTRTLCVNTLSNKKKTKWDIMGKIDIISVGASIQDHCMKNSSNIVDSNLAIQTR